MSKLTLMDPNVAKDTEFFDSRDHTPNKSFCSLIVGAPGAGKSYVVHNILSHPALLRKAFHWVFLVSPSPKDLDLKIPKERVTTTLDPHWIAQQVEWCREQIRKSVVKRKEPLHISKAKPASICFIFDDVISGLKEADLAGTSLLTDLFFNRRHFFDVTNKKGKCKHLLSASIIVTTQQYKLMPLKWRQVCNWLIVFKQHVDQLKAIFSEAVYGQLFDDFMKVCDEAFETHHGVVQIRNYLDPTKAVKIGFP